MEVPDLTKEVSNLSKLFIGDLLLQMRLRQQLHIISIIL